ncbi:ATP-dependent protease La domain protein [Fulvivirga imtechensis AK7]|uniref:ATP-dependent protease La domain protein n=1 Tax=Fulvivirga imtechensis AK7 TaxID=1237149 RepID=L8JRB8_9BACT|nr:LON peptidase substrate-binding domain-containing protein [Fulvivirga imtechensis]ELR70039.1 ATP-dependent protease La domain protein [Fulvivirga imtechensis AK7]
MEQLVEIPVFPLSILPLPNELIPLHIFENRYRELLQDIEDKGGVFGIYYTHGLNTDRIGSLMKLEGILKRYDSGESDVVTKCIDTFLLTKFYNQWLPKPYPGGEVYMLHVNAEQQVSQRFSDEFRAYMALKKVSDVGTDFNIHDIANELNLDIGDRLKYLRLLTNDKRESFLRERLKYQKFILQQELKHKDNFYLN